MQGMETLSQYLNGKRKGEFARAVGISPAYLSQILGGMRSPSLSLMRRFYAASGGEVDLNSWATKRSATVKGGGGKRSAQGCTPKDSVV